jgi:hypothetical protein
MRLAALSTLFTKTNYLPCALWALLLIAANSHSQDPTTADQPPTETQSSLAVSETQSSANSSIEPPPYESRAQRNRTLVAKALPDESLWLDTEYGKILAMHRVTEAKSTFGTLILIHAAEDPQRWPTTLENLRANLPRYGWETLAIAVPQKTLVPVPGRSFSSASSGSPAESDSDSGAEPANSAAEKPIDESASSSTAASISREQLIAAYLNAAVQYLIKNNQLNFVLLTDNSSAYHSLVKLKPLFEETPTSSDSTNAWLRAVILTNLQPLEPLDKGELESIFQPSQLPIMDIFFAPDYNEQRNARDLHRAVAMRQKMEKYRQLKLDNQPNATEGDFQSFLLGRIRGFMQRHAKGTEKKLTRDDSSPTTLTN